MQRLMDRDLLTALVLFGIGAVAWSGSGDDVKDWIFPLLAAYLVLGIAVALLARVIFAAVMRQAPDIVDGFRENRIVIVDLLVFSAIVLVYILVMNGLGFWLASFLMLLLASTYLTMNKTRRNLILAAVVPLCACILAYFIFLRVFYVPLPEATWWPGVS
ncbi:MAG: tripartite tricarboxylate transporter TctB family protein [Alphaproteobacteria bacterium]|nr:tripartite tricarboxylate transporter TctB family protein [Alphaproteobacteria bacterium]